MVGPCCLAVIPLENPGLPHARQATCFPLTWAPGTPGMCELGTEVSLGPRGCGVQ